MCDQIKLPTNNVEYQNLIFKYPDRVLNWETEESNQIPFAHHLIQENQIDALKILTKEIPEALCQTTQYDETVLYFALKLENYEIARYLLQLDRSQSTLFFYGSASGGESPLTIACDTFCCPNDIIYKLLENGPVFKEEELKLALYNAVKSRNFDAIILLLDHDVTMLNEKLDQKSGKYLMHLVFEGKIYLEEIFDHLWKNYRKMIDWRVLDNQKTTIFHSAMRSTLYTSKLLDLLNLFPQYFPTDFQDIKGNTLLHLAVAWDDISVVKFCCEDLRINSRIKNHDSENALKAAVYRASLGQWDLFNDKISYLIERMFKPPHGTFCFEAVADLFNLTSMHRFYQTNSRLYPLLIAACYLEETNPFKDLIQEFLKTFDDNSIIKTHFICIFLHDKAVVYPEHQSKRREIIFALGQCVKKAIHQPNISFSPLINVIKALQTVPGFTIDSNEFCDYSGIHYYDLFFITDDDKFSDVRTRSKLIEFYYKFDALNIINFDDIIDINLCKILFHKGMNQNDKKWLVNNEIFRIQLHLANKVAIRPKGVLNNIYDTEDFRLIEQFLGQYDFNRVCYGKKIMSLKLMCREKCRSFVLSKKIKGINREYVIRSLGLPRVLESFLQYRD